MPRNSPALPFPEACRHRLEFRGIATKVSGIHDLGRSNSNEPISTSSSRNPIVAAVGVRIALNIWTARVGRGRQARSY